MYLPTGTTPCNPPPARPQGIANGSLTVGDAVLFVTLMQQLYGPLNFFGTCEGRTATGVCAALAGLLLQLMQMNTSDACTGVVQAAVIVNFFWQLPSAMQWFSHLLLQTTA